MKIPLSILRVHHLLVCCVMVLVITYSISCHIHPHPQYTAWTRAPNVSYMRIQRVTASPVLQSLLHARCLQWGKHLTVPPCASMMWPHARGASCLSLQKQHPRCVWTLGVVVMTHHLIISLSHMSSYHRIYHLIIAHIIHNTHSLSHTHISSTGICGHVFQCRWEGPVLSSRGP